MWKYRPIQYLSVFSLPLPACFIIALKTQDISLMIACQPTAQRAVRLELLLPQEETGLNVPDPFDKLQVSKAISKDNVSILS
jgi:hypothetical protein